MKNVLITGSSSGIGQATARLLARNGYRLVICGRREDRLKALVEELRAFTEVCSLTFDVRNRDAVQKAISGIPEPFRPIDVLINNAGNAHGLDYLQEGHWDDWDAMLDINVKGLLYVTKCILDDMVSRESGHIINIGSTAGKEVYPKGNVYCASKHAVDALNQAMRIDLNQHGIRVGAINPGLVETEFSAVRFKGDQERAKTVYQGYSPLQAEDIARILFFVLEQPAHVNIADLVVMPTDQASSTQIRKR